MPTGPQHDYSGGSSGGGSFNFSSEGGDFGSSGGSYYGGSRGRRAPRPPRPGFAFIYVNGRPYEVTSKFQRGYSLLVMFQILLIVLIAIFGSFLSSRSGSADTKSIMESDAEYYSEAISLADASGTSGYYLATATYENRYYYDYSYVDSHDIPTGIYEWGTYKGITYYWIVYEYDVGGRTYKGQTYAQYTQNYFFGQSSGKCQLQIVYAKDGAAYASINSDYTLEKNIEYKDICDQVVEYNGFLAAIIVAAVIFVALLVTSIVMFKKRAQEVKADDGEASGTKQESESSETKVQRKMCSYCGSVVSSDTMRCPSCGSKKFIKYKESEKE